MTDDERASCHGRVSGGHEPGYNTNGLHGICRHCDRPISNILGVWMLRSGEAILQPEPKGKLTFIDAAGLVTNCDRCGDPCRVADKRHPDSAPFRLSAKPKGVCANCVMTQFLYNTYPINLQVDEAGPELLLKPGVREAFLSCGLLNGCDLNIDEVNWAKVVANWNLPIALVKSPLNPYRMGDSPKSYTKRGQAQEKPVDEFSKKWGPILDESGGTLSGDVGRRFMEESGLRSLLDQAKGTVQ